MDKPCACIPGEQCDYHAATMFKATTITTTFVPLGNWRRRYVVGHISCKGPRFYFPTVKEASKYIGNQISEYDREGVLNGNYYIDPLEGE